jgi:ketosteroid isomerase-like protein
MAGPVAKKEEIMTSQESEIRNILTRLLDAFNCHDLDAIMEHFAEDATLDRS